MQKQKLTGKRRLKARERQMERLRPSRKERRTLTGMETVMERLRQMPML